MLETEVTQNLSHNKIDNNEYYPPLMSDLKLTIPGNLCNFNYFHVISLPCTSCHLSNISDRGRDSDIYVSRHLKIARGSLVHIITNV